MTHKSIEEMSEQELAILGRNLNNVICKALNIDPSRVRRVIIDSPWDEAVTVHVELFGTKLLRLDWKTLLDGGEVKTVNAATGEVELK